MSNKNPFSQNKYIRKNYYNIIFSFFTLVKYLFSSLLLQVKILLVSLNYIDNRRNLDYFNTKEK